MRLEVYSKKHKEVWNDFVSTSKNGTFLFHRDFMEYHSDRFNDYSLLFYKKDSLIAVLPGNIDGKIYYSHQGLTYGGLIVNEKIRSVDVLEIFECLINLLKQKEIEEVVYKVIPHIYHKLPAEEDLYALFRYEARLVGRNISSTICFDNSITYSQQRKRGLQRGRKAGLYVDDNNEFEGFWSILSSNLKERYQVKPVHSLTEVQFLKTRFPDNIKLYNAYDLEKKVLAGVVVFETDTVAHLQYIATNDDGRINGALDFVIDHVLSKYAKQKMYFDFGTSTENNGKYLNEGLIRQKEGFGGRATVYDIYSIKLK